MVSYLSKLQRQLPQIYRGDQILRNQIVAAVDLLNIRRDTSQMMPKTSLEAQNKIATFLSREPGSAETYQIEEDAFFSTTTK